MKLFSKHYVLIIIILNVLLFANKNGPVTVITSEDIKNSSANNLLEILEMYTPDFIYLVDSSQGFRIASNGIVTNNEKVALYVNDIPLKSYYNNGAAWCFSGQFLSYIDSIILSPVQEFYLPPENKPSGSIRIYTKESNKDLLISGTTSFIKRDRMRYSLAGNYAYNLDSFSIAVSANYTENSGNSDNRFFGSSTENFSTGIDSLVYIPGDTGTQFRGVTPYTTSGDALVNFNVSFKDFSLFAQYSTNETPLGASQLLDLFSVTETWNSFINGLNFKKEFDNGQRLHTKFSYTQGESIIHANEPGLKTTYTNSDEQTLRYFLSFTNSAMKSLQFATGATGNYTTIKSKTNTIPNRKEHSVWLNVRLNNLKETISPSVKVMVTNKNRENTFLTPVLSLALCPTKNHAITLSAQTATHFLSGPMTQVYPTNPNNLYPDNWSYKNGHLFDSADIDSIEKNPYLLGTLIPPTTVKTLKEKSYILDFNTKHVLAKSVTLQTKTSLQQLKGYTIYDHKHENYQNKPQISTFTTSLVGSGEFSKFEYLASCTYNRQLRIQHTRVELTIPEDTPVWDNLSKSWIPEFESIDLDDKEYDTLTNYLFARDGINFNNIPTLTTKFNSIYKPTEKLSIHCNSRIFWGLKGREEIHKIIESLSSNQLNHLSLDRKPIIKLDLATSYEFPLGFIVKMGVKNLLGNPDSHHSFRWEQMHGPNDASYFNYDQRRFTLDLFKEF